MGLYFPSRKQYEWFQDRQGPAKRLENPVTLVNSTDINVVIGTATQTLYTATAGTKARLLYLQFFPSTSTFSSVEILIDGERLYLWLPSVSPPIVEFRWDINDGPQFYSSIQCRYTATAASTPGLYSSFIVNTEPAGEGYFQN